MASPTRPTSSTAPPATRSRASAIGTLIVLFLALLGYMTLENMLPPALPTIQQAVGASTPAIAWVFTGLMLSGAVLSPVVGRLGDIRNKRFVLLGVMAVLAVGVLLPALAPNMVLLTIGQILQGAAAGLTALAVGLLNDTQPVERAKAGNGFLVATGGVGTVVGLLAAGPILSVLPYNWLYWIPLVLILVALVGAWFVVPSVPPTQRGQVDWRGAALLAAGLVLLLIGITQSSALGWTSVIVVGLVLGGLLMLGVFVLVELRTAEPLVDLSLLKLRAVLVTCVVAFVAGFGTIALFVAVPTLVALPAQTGYGLGGSPLLTGRYLVPLGVVALLVAPLTGILERAISSRGVLMVANGTMVASALVLLGVPGRPWLIAVSTGLVGVTFGLGLTQAMNVVVTVVPAERVASVGALAFVVRAVGGTLGAQVTASLLASMTNAGVALPAWTGFRAAFLVIAAVGIGAVFLSMAFPSRLTIPSAQ